MHGAGYVGSSDDGWQPKLTCADARSARDSGLAHSVRVPKKGKGGLHGHLHYHWCRRRCAVYCGLSRVPLEDRVTREIGLYATPGDVREAEGTRLRVQGVTPCGGSKRVVA